MTADPPTPPGDLGVLLVFAKEPRAGRAKTRLAAGVGPEAAARLAEAFLLDTLEACRGVPGAELWVSTDAGSSAEYFRAAAPDARLFVQPEGDLGVRLAAAFEAAFAAGARRVVALGADTPHLAPTRLREALTALAAGRVVVGPTRDGGYDLIGLAGPHPELFRGVAWSTERVLEQTAARAAEAGLSLSRLAETFDVDTPADLERLRELLKREPDLARNTRRLLFEAISEGPRDGFS